MIPSMKEWRLPAGIEGDVEGWPGHGADHALVEAFLHASDEQVLRFCFETGLCADAVLRVRLVMRARKRIS
jgi:hypothetical protein